MWRIAAENQRTVKLLMNISRRKSEWVGVQESKVRGSCNTWHLSSIEHPPQGSISTQDWACCLERPSECA